VSQFQVQIVTKRCDYYYRVNVLVLLLVLSPSTAATAVYDTTGRLRQRTGPGALWAATSPPAPGLAGSGAIIRPAPVIAGVATTC
jgi:hypothetical protein